MNEKHHSNDITIEELLKKEFKAERFDLGGIIDADYIDRYSNFWNCITILLARHYSTSDTIQKQKIDEFLEKHNELSKTELKNVSQENFDLIISELSKLINELN